MPALDVVPRLEAQSEQQPAVGELVQGRRLERHRHRRAAPDADHPGAEQEPVGAVAVAVAGPNESPKVISGNQAARKPASSTRRPYVDREPRRDGLDEEVEPVHSCSPPSKIASGTSENGTPPSGVTSHVSCM